MDASPNQSLNLRKFEIQNGLVISESGQQDADDFAADFQGLRHFGDRVGGALELGGVVYATLHEPAFTFLFKIANDGGSQTRTTGAMIAANVSNNEILAAITPANA
jgi:hypothetical protein